MSLRANTTVTPYDSYEVSLVYTYEDEHGDRYCVTDRLDEPDNPHTCADTFWSIYGITAGIREHIGDFVDRDSALLVVARITGVLLVDVHEADTSHIIHSARLQ